MVFEFLKKLLPSKRTPFDNIIYLIKKEDTQRAILELQTLKRKAKGSTRSFIKLVILRLQAEDYQGALKLLKQK